MTQTLAQLIATGSPIYWACDVVQEHYGRADLVAMVEAKGEAFVLVNRQPGCKVPGCPGRVTFRNRSRVFPVTLETIRDGDEAWWDYAEMERRRLKAEGWTMEAGKWVAPRG